MGEGQDARRGDDDSQHADCRGARVAAGQDPLLDPGGRRDQGRRGGLPGEAGRRRSRRDAARRRLGWNIPPRSLRSLPPRGLVSRSGRPFPTDIVPITLTENAARHVAANLEKRGKGVGLRLGVRTSGCSGLAYKIDYADDVRPEDALFESHGVRVIVDPKSLPYLEGTELDFTREGLNEGFKFNNPNVKDSCGCGESFNV